MRPLKILTLQEEEKKVLEHRFRTHDSAAVRSRCQVILLKAQGRPADDIASITDRSVISVYSWVKRYRSEGIDGLLTREGRGRKKILTPEEDAAVITETITAHRQSLKAAKAAYEAACGSKVVSEDTLRRFLKVLATPIKESGSGWVKKRTKRYTNIK